MGNRRKQDKENLQLNVDYPEDLFTVSKQEAQRQKGRLMSA